MSEGPLSGKRVMITRSRAQAGELASLIQEQGGEPYVFPVIKIVPPSDWSQVDAVVREIQSYDWIVFTSANGIHFFFQRMEELGMEKSKIRAKLAAVGAKTANALLAQGVHANLVPKDFVAESLLEELQTQLIPGQKVLLPRADIARKMLPEQLRELGFLVTELDVYENIPASDNTAEARKLLQTGEINAITFTSSSAAANFAKIFADEPLDQMLKDTLIACIGPVTAETAIKSGLRVDVVPETYTINGMLEALASTFSPDNRGTSKE